MFRRGVAVEMGPDNVRLLRCNIALASCSERIQVWDVALSDAIGEATAEFSQSNHGDHRLRAATGGPSPSDAYGESRRATNSVRTTTLDALEAESGVRFDDGTLIWIDTQGHEGHVLAGARRVLSREHPPACVLEFWPYGLARAGGLSRLMEALGRCRAIYDLGVPLWNSQPPVSLSALNQTYERAIREERIHQHTDLLCLFGPGDRSMENG